MNAFESLRRRAGTFGAGIVSFLALIAALRWSNNEPLLQPNSDIGILIGAALVALYFVLSDALAPQNGPNKGRRLEKR